MTDSTRSHFKTNLLTTVSTLNLHTKKQFILIYLHQYCEDFAVNSLGHICDLLLLLFLSTSLHSSLLSLSTFSPQLDDSPLESGPTLGFIPQPMSHLAWSEGPSKVVLSFSVCCALRSLCLWFKAVQIQNWSIDLWIDDTKTDQVL